MSEGLDQDRRLVEAALRGDAEAFGELVRRHQRLVASVAWRIGIHRDAIEDVVSEVFLKVFENLRRYRPEFPFSTWLYRLAMNHALDHARRERRTPRPGEIDVDLLDPGDPADAGIAARERAARVRAALKTLDHRFRAALYLVYVEGLSVDAAARALGVPPGTVKTRLLRGRRALQQELERRHPGEFGG
jgi:RNA polymerase sigma-70 factor (ECF subfamily)